MLLSNDLKKYYLSIVMFCFNVFNFCFILISAIVVSLYEDPVQPQQAALVVEKLGDHLVSHGY